LFDADGTLLDFDRAEVAALGKGSIPHHMFAVNRLNTSPTPLHSALINLPRAEVILLRVH
jgi:FMN phosphatase YigB (HAD superfamily)